MPTYHPKLKSIIWPSRNRVGHGALLGLLFILLAALQPVSAQNQLGNYKANSGVSTAVFQGSLFMAFIGIGGTDCINIGQSSDGLNWGIQWQLPNGSNCQRSFDSPSLTSFNGKLWLAWTGEVSSGSNINIASSTDAHNFSDVVLSYTSAHGVSLYANNGTLWLAWVPANSNSTINVISSTDGVSWSAIREIGLPNTQSPWTPTIASYGTSTSVGYTRPSLPEDPHNRLQLAVLSGGIGVTPPNPSTGVNAGAGIGWDGGSLFYYAWVGPGASSEEWVTTYQLQSSGAWAVITQQDMAHSGISTPNIVGNYNGHSFLIFPGTDSQHHVNVLTLK